MNSKFVVPGQLVKSLDELIAEEKKTSKKGGSQFFKKAIKKDKRYLGEDEGGYQNFQDESSNF